MGFGEYFSKFYEKFSGKTYRKTKVGSKLDKHMDLLDDIKEATHREKKELNKYLKQLKDGDITKHQYKHLISGSEKTFRGTVDNLEKMMKHAAIAVLIFFGISLTIYSFYTPTITGYTVMGKGFDANLLMLALLSMAAALLFLLKLNKGWGKKR